MFEFLILVTKKTNSHSAHGPNDFQDNSTTVFPSPTSQGAFHLRSPRPQYAASTVPNSDSLYRSLPGVLQHQLSGSAFPHAGNFPAKTNSVQSPVHPWRGPSGYCDSPVVDSSGRGRRWSLSADEQMCLGRGVESSGKFLLGVCSITSNIIKSNLINWGTSAASWR